MRLHGRVLVAAGPAPLFLVFFGALGYLAARSEPVLMKELFGTRFALFMAVPVVIALAASLTAALAAKSDRGTAEEAEAMVKKAVAHLQAVGAERAYQDFTNQAPGFACPDLYLVVYDGEGRVLAHGRNPGLVGKELEMPPRVP